MIKAFDWFKERLTERSTLTDISAAVVAAAALPGRWSIVCFLVLSAKAMIPDKGAS